MGANLDYVVIQDGTQQQLRDRFKEACEEARYEHGHGGYTGVIGEMHGIDKIVDRDFSTEDEAINYLSAHHKKWDGGMAVSFRQDGKPNKAAAKASDRNIARVATLCAREGKTAKAIIERFKARKTKLVGCKTCGSRFSHEHLCKRIPTDSTGEWALKAFACPLCGQQDALLSTTDSQRWRKALAEFRAAETEARKPVPTTGGRKAWVVGGWCSS